MAAANLTEVLAEHHQDFSAGPFAIGCGCGAALPSDAAHQAHVAEVIVAAGWVSPEQYRDQVKLVAVLETWKDEAMEVMDGLDALGKALGLPLGEQITGTAAAETAARLSARLAEVRAIHHEWGETDADDINQQRLWERIGYALTREEASHG